MTSFTVWPPWSHTVKNTFAKTTFLKSQQFCIGSYRNKQGLKTLARKQGQNSTTTLRFWCKFKKSTKQQIGQCEVKITRRISLLLVAFASFHVGIFYHVLYCLYFLLNWFFVLDWNRKLHKMCLFYISKKHFDDKSSSFSMIYLCLSFKPDGLLKKHVSFFFSNPGSGFGDVNISAILNSFQMGYDKRVRPNYGGKDTNIFRI